MVVASIFGGIWTGIEGVFIAVVNNLIAALGGAVSGLLSILPNMPALPTLPDAFVTAEAWVAWFFPVGTVVDIIAAFTSLWVLWMGVSLILNWAKARV